MSTRDVGQMPDRCSASVAAVIPAWNHLADTLACLDSLGRTGYPKLRILVVDNGSAPPLGDAIIARFPDVSVIRSDTNLGFVGGVNLGLQWSLRSDPDYVLLLNNDTEVAPDTIYLLVDAAECASEYQVFSPVITYYNDRDRVWFAGGGWDEAAGNVQYLRMKEPVSEVPEHVYPTVWANGCALFAGRAVFEAVGLLDSDYVAVWDEVDWCFRARRQGFRCAIQPRARVAHRVSATFVETSVSWRNYLFFRNRVLFLKKHYGLLRGWESAAGQCLVAARRLAVATLRRDHVNASGYAAQWHGSVDGALGRLDDRVPGGSSRTRKRPSARAWSALKRRVHDTGSSTGRS